MGQQVKATVFNNPSELCFMYYPAPNRNSNTMVNFILDNLPLYYITVMFVHSVRQVRTFRTIIHSSCSLHTRKGITIFVEKQQILANTGEKEFLPSCHALLET